MEFSANMALYNWTQKLLAAVVFKFLNNTHQTTMDTQEATSLPIIFLFLTQTATKNTMLFLLIFLLLTPAAPQPLLRRNNNNIFLLAGQSNMAGRGGVVNNTVTGVTTWDGFVPPECRPNPSVLRLSARLQWEEAAEPLHADIDYKRTNGIGPGMAFANAVSAKLGMVGLVPCAMGGSDIKQWARGSVLYNQLVTRARAAVRDGGSIRALLWYQGESDTMSKEEAEMYRSRLVKFFLDVGDDLHLPMIPIIQVALASGQGAYLERVRKAQLGIELPNVKTIDAKGLPIGMDGLHLTTLAQVRLGHMLSDAFLQSSSLNPTLLPVSLKTSTASIPVYASTTTTWPLFSLLLLLLC